MRIGSWAFYDYSWLKIVVIPESVEWIGDCAFNKCKNATIILKKPEKDFKKIGWSAFYNVKDVKEKIGS